MANFRILAALCLVATVGCTTTEQRAASYRHLSCEQLVVALDYERRAERESRREGVLLGVASILDGSDDSDLVELDSDISFLDADNSRARAEAVTYEMQRRCGHPRDDGGER